MPVCNTWIEKKSHVSFWTHTPRDSPGLSAGARGLAGHSRDAGRCAGRARARRPRRRRWPARAGGTRAPQPRRCRWRGGGPGRPGPYIWSHPDGAMRRPGRIRRRLVRSRDRVPVAVGMHAVRPSATFVRNRQRPRPARGRVRREPAGHAPQARRPLQDIDAGRLAHRHEDQPRPRLLPRGHPRHGRDRALATARAIAEGRDPRRRMRQVPAVAQAMIAFRVESWKSERTEGQWRANVRDCVLPRLAADRPAVRPFRRGAWLTVLPKALPAPPAECGIGGSEARRAIAPGDDVVFPISGMMINPRSGSPRPQNWRTKLSSARSRS